MKRRSFPIATLFLPSLVVPCTAAPQASSVTRVLGKGDTYAICNAANPPTSILYGALGVPYLANTGGTHELVVVTGLMTTAGCVGSGNDGIVIKATATASPTITVIAREGDPAPSPYGNWTSLIYAQNLHVNSSGYAGITAKPSTGEIALFHHVSGTVVAEVDDTNTTAPGGGVFFGFWNQRSLASDGTYHFVANRVTGGGSPLGIYWSNGPTKFVEVGDAVPGQPGVVFSSIGSLASGFVPDFNQAGTSAFRGDTSASASSDIGIWTGTAGGTPTLVAQEGSAAPGVTGSNFLNLYSPSIDDADGIAFVGAYASAGAREGVWSDASGSLTLVAKKSDAAPGTSSTFNYFYDPAIGGGWVAFKANLAGGSHGLWVRDAASGGALSCIAAVGDAVPGAPSAGWTFVSLPADLAVNAQGQVAFLAGVEDGSGAYHDGVFATTTGGALVSLALESDSLGGSTIQSLAFQAGSVARGQSGLSDGTGSGSGQVAFRCQFVGGAEALYAAIP